VEGEVAKIIGETNIQAVFFDKDCSGKETPEQDGKERKYCKMRTIRRLMGKKIVFYLPDFTQDLFCQ
jgi:hypothetical protein